MLPGDRWAPSHDVSDSEVTRLRAELERAIETRENANTVSVRVELENKRFREALWQVVQNLDGNDPDGNIFPKAALRVAREALASEGSDR